MTEIQFFGRLGELEVLEDAYASRTAEMAIIYGRRRVGKTALIQQFCKGKAFFSTRRKPGKTLINWSNFLELSVLFAETPNNAFCSGMLRSELSPTFLQKSGLSSSLTNFSTLLRNAPAFFPSCKFSGTRSFQTKTSCLFYAEVPSPLLPKKSSEKKIRFLAVPEQP